MEHPAPSTGSAFSWNTFLSRTTTSSLARAVFSEQQRHPVHGLEDVIRVVGSLSLRRYRREELVRQGPLGEGETYLVERCAAQGSIVAVKQLKIDGSSGEGTFRRRLTSIVFEAQIMRHPPLRAHPNLPCALGYGWDLLAGSLIPYLVVEYAPLGTMRQYLGGIKPQLVDVEILLGDVASALAALHTCYIIHGDVKLDNVLVFPSWDRPAKALAKITDFGHAIILNEKSEGHEDDIIKYGGTVLYNAPEVRTQDLFPIPRSELCKCDIWAFGLLVWEACLSGQDYRQYLAKVGAIADPNVDNPALGSAELMKHAYGCLPKEKFGTPFFLRIAFHRTIQDDPSRRATNMQDLPLFTRWNAGDIRGLEADLALHFEQPTPSYEMFRLDTGKEILPDHQRQIFEGLNRTHASAATKMRGSVGWQIALCHDFGFGTAQNKTSAAVYAQKAKSEGHTVAMVFGDLFESQEDDTEEPKGDTYSSRVSQLMSSNMAFSEGMPPLSKAFLDGDSVTALGLLDQGASASSCTADGCSPFHWLFRFEDTAFFDKLTRRVPLDFARHLVNIPMCSVRQPHLQWPLQLVGSPLAVAISVNSLTAVNALLSLGADPFLPIFDETRFSPDDARSQWTAFHMAVKYHCSEILQHLMAQSDPHKLESLSPLAHALHLSTSLERRAMHGTEFPRQLDETIRLIRNVQNLGAADTDGRTALMEAIDFDDFDVVEAILRVEPELASTPFRSPQDDSLFTYPIHFSSQISARRDNPKSRNTAMLISRHTHDLDPSHVPPRDHGGRNPLHLAATGSLPTTARWILEQRPGLVHVEDNHGRTPLHYCASASNANLLLEAGANVDHTDKQGLTTMHRACLFGNSELVDCLLKLKPRLDLKHNLYGTPLHCAVIYGSVGIVKALIDSGAPIDGADLKGNTAVHVAARLHRHAILRLLMLNQANADLRNSNGRNAADIALGEPQLGSVGTLSILQRSSKPGDRNTHVLGFDGDMIDAASSQHAAEHTPEPDFLWGKTSLPNQESNNLVNPTQHADVIAEKEETYDEKVRRMEIMDQIISSVLSDHLSNVYCKRWAIDELVNLVSVFFDAGIWQPSLSKRVIEIMARIALDFAAILHSCYDEAWCRHLRSKAWAGFLSKHNGVSVALRLEAIRHYPNGRNPLSGIQRPAGQAFSPSVDRTLAVDSLYGVSKDLLTAQDRLEAVWKYMEENDPTETLENFEARLEAGSTGRNTRLADGLSANFISLGRLLSYMEFKFPIEKRDRPASERPLVPEAAIDLDDLVILDPGNLLQLDSDDEDLADEKTLTEEAGSEEKHIPKLDGGKSRVDSDSQSSIVQEPPEDETRYGHEPCQEQSGWCSHMDLAVDWVSALVAEKKPRDKFPGRQKSDMEAMIRWEMRSLEIPALEPGRRMPYASTLSRHFPSLSSQSWRTSASREYTDWKGKQHAALQREALRRDGIAAADPWWNSADQVARDEFYKRLYAHCQDAI